MGRDSWALGRDSWALGRDSWALGHDSWALGHDSWALGHDSWALGHDSWALGHDSWALGNDIGEYGKVLKLLTDPSSEMLEEWLIYTCFKEVPIGSLDVLQDFWDSMSGRFPLLSKIAVNYIWMPVTSVDIECSFSEYKHLLNGRRERLTEENTRQLMILIIMGYRAPFLKHL